MYTVNLRINSLISNFGENRAAYLKGPLIGGGGRQLFNFSLIVA